MFDDHAPFSYIEGKAALDKAAMLEELREDYKRNTPDNIHDYISWWDEPGKRVKTASSVVAHLAQKEKKQKVQRRNKKQAG